MRTPRVPTGSRPIAEGSRKFATAAEAQSYLDDRWDEDDQRFIIRQMHVGARTADAIASLRERRAWFNGQRGLGPRTPVPAPIATPARDRLAALSHLANLHAQLDHALDDARRLGREFVGFIEANPEVDKNVKAWTSRMQMTAAFAIVAARTIEGGQEIEAPALAALSMRIGTEPLTADEDERLLIEAAWRNLAGKARRSIVPVLDRLLEEWRVANLPAGAGAAAAAMTQTSPLPAKTADTAETAKTAKTAKTVPQRKTKATKNATMKTSKKANPKR